MGKKYILFFFLALLFVSCPVDSSTESINSSVDSVKLTATKDINYFYINDSNSMQTLICNFFDESGNVVSGKVEWETNLPESVSSAYSDNSYTFNLDSINVLGDYYVKAKIRDDLSSVYAFSLLSRDSLQNCLCYSYVSDFQVEVSDSGNISLFNAVEYDENNILITTEEERMLLNNILEYRFNGDNLILVSVKEGSSFGQLNIQTNSDSLYYVPVNSNQFVLYSNGETNSNVQLKINAGDKDTRTVNVILCSDESNSLASPKFFPSYTADSEGIIVNVQGDNVSTSFYQFLGGNKLNIDVYRKSYGGTEDYKLYDFNSNEETHDIKFGKALHLANCGEYRIEAYITNAVGYKSAVSCMDYIVQPFPAPDSDVITITPLNPVEEIFSSDRWDDYIEGDETPRSKYYNVTIKNNDPLYDYFYTISFENDEINYGDFEESGVISHNEKFSKYLIYGGDYIVNVYQRGNALNYGFALEDESPLIVQKSCKVEGCSYYDERLPITVTVDEDGTIYIKSAYELGDDEHIYVGVYIGDELESSFELNALNQEKTILNPTFAIYNFKAYIFSDIQRISSNISVYNLDTVNLSSYALPAKIDVSDIVQTTYNRRVAEISSSEDANGVYREIRYKLGDGDWSEWQKPDSNGKLIVTSNIRSNNSQETISVEMRATDNELGVGIVSSSAVMKLTKMFTPEVWAHCKLSMFTGEVWLGFRCSFRSSIKGKIAYATFYRMDEKRNSITHSNSGSTSSDDWCYLYNWSDGWKWLSSNDMKHEISAYQKAYGYIDSDWVTTGCGGSYYGSGAMDNYAGVE